MIFAKNIIVKPKRTMLITEALISLGIFFLALIPRAYDLSRFVTADEAKWVYRSARFLAAFLEVDWAGTTVNLTPAVTTTWLGSFGLFVYYRLNQAAIGLPFSDWLLTLPEFRTELDLLVVTRWPMILITSLSIVAIYWLVCYLFDPSVALIAATFIALDPHPIALSRVLGHDAPVAMFMTLSLLLLLAAVKRANLQDVASWFLFGLSGVMAGLAFLSKAPALFLIPFAGLMALSKILAAPAKHFFLFKRFFLWGVMAYLTFVLVWPAAWVDPFGRPLAVLENAISSATDEVEVQAEGFWRVPNLGPFYYIVNGGFKLSPLVMVGAGLTILFLIKQRQKRSTQSHLELPTSNYQSPISPSLLLWLFAFILLFTLFMTVGGKRSPRYILPIFPTISIVAAVGWLKLFQFSIATFDRPHLRFVISRGAFYIILTLSTLILLYPYAPYYFTYFNPLLGGALTAPRLVKIGWGEGLDQVGRFLQRELPASRVGTAYASTVAPFFTGDLAGLNSSRLDYVVLYSKQVQSGNYPLEPETVRYYEQLDPIFSVDLNGIHYADVYPGPAVQSTQSQAVPRDQREAMHPIGFRPLKAYGEIGQPLTVDVVWAAKELPLTGDLSATLALTSTIKAGAEPSTLPKSEGMLTSFGGEGVTSRHELIIPADLPRGLYTLQIGNQVLGEVDIRNFETPNNLAKEFHVFEQQIAVTGYQFSPTEDYIQVTIAWQAMQSHLPDYTVFVQLLNAETDERMAGIDYQPKKGAWPTSRWVKGEVVVDEYFVAVPPGLQPGFFKIIVGLYDPQTGQRLTLPSGHDHWPLPWTVIRKDNAP